MHSKVIIIIPSLGHLEDKNNGRHLIYTQNPYDQQIALVWLQRKIMSIRNKLIITIYVELKKAHLEYYYKFSN